MTTIRDAGMRPADAIHNDRILMLIADHDAWIAQAAPDGIAAATEGMTAAQIIAWADARRIAALELLGRAVALHRISLGDSAIPAKAHAPLCEDCYWASDEDPATCRCACHVPPWMR
jgi:hypothetical protein